MSERLANTSTAQSEIDAFTAAKKAEAKQLLLEDIFADSVTGHREEDEKRVQEGAEYYKHLEELAKRSDDYDPYNNETTHTAFDREWDDAIAENEAFDAARNEAQAAFEAKMQADPTIRRMNMIANNIAELRAKLVTPETADADAKRVDDLEDKLTELLAEYSDSPDYDAAIESYIIDRTAEAGGSGDNEPVAQAAAEPAAPSASPEQPAAEQTNVRVESEAREESDDTDDSDEVLVPTDHPAEDAVRDDESLEEYEERIGANREPVPLIGDSIEISDPLELTANDAEEEQTPAEEAAERQDAPEAEVAPNTNRLTWRDALRNPGAYLATRMENYRLSHQRIDDDHTGERRGISDKNLKRLVGVVAGVVIAVSAYKLGNDIFGDHSALADAANNAAGNHPGGNIGGDVAPTPAAPAPAVEGSGQNWNVPNYSEAARTVTAGEGFNQTFLEMNIPESEWPSLLQKVGPQLPDWAYRMPNGSWGISHTGTLPDSVLQLIENNR
jgi:hypothetical protein